MNRLIADLSTLSLSRMLVNYSRSPPPIGNGCLFAYNFYLIANAATHWVAFCRPVSTGMHFYTVNFCYLACVGLQAMDHNKTCWLQRWQRSLHDNLVTWIVRVLLCYIMQLDSAWEKVGFCLGLAFTFPIKAHPIREVVEGKQESSGWVSAIKMVRIQR